MAFCMVNNCPCYKDGYCLKIETTINEFGFCAELYKGNQQKRSDLVSEALPARNIIIEEIEE